MKDNESYTFVSVIIPCRNEVNYIENLINSILESDYNSDFFEIIIVDGISSDGTRNLITNKYLSIYKNISLIDNINKKTPYAFNLGIKNSIGEIILIVGARHTISKNYIKEVVGVLTKSDEIGCVGGVTDNLYENEISRYISLAMSSPFGVGFNNFRSIKKDMFVDTIGTPAYRKSIFSDIGYFDESLTRNQDDDFNYRLIKKGYKILLKSNISITYIVRSNYYSLYKQYRQYAYWKVFVNKKHKSITTLRQLFPVIFMLSIIIFSIISLFYPIVFYILIFELLVYFILNIIFALKDNLFNIKNVIGQVFSCFVLHFSYGLGYIEGIIDFIFFNKTPNKNHESLSR
jgi:glycosyltransferase involved in cell wall biosynthesis